MRTRPVRDVLRVPEDMLDAVADERVRVRTVAKARVRFPPAEPLPAELSDLRSGQCELGLGAGESGGRWRLAAEAGLVGRAAAAAEVAAGEPGGAHEGNVVVRRAGLGIRAEVPA